MGRSDCIPLSQSRLDYAVKVGAGEGGAPRLSGVTSRITADDVVHVARLARLSLTDDEVTTFTDQLAAVLDHAADVEALSIDDVPPMIHPWPLRNVMRPDEIGATLDRDEVLTQAPATEEGQFRVPAILGDEP